MVIFKDTELGDMNISLNTKSEIRLISKIFKKEQVLPKELESQIPQIIKNYILKKSEFFVVEHQLHFSIWVEKTA